MPTKSPYPDVDIPNVDLWAYMFDRPRDFSDSKVIYRAFDTDRHYTFKDVRAAATAFGEGLVELWDWQRNDVFNIYAPNDVDVPAVLYGIFYAGGIVSPANPAYGVDELAFQLKNSGSKAIVTTKSFYANALAAAKKSGIDESRIILLGPERDDGHRIKHWTNIRKTSGALRYRRRKVANPAKDLAFIVYSSGTTGLPKGVMLTHRNIVGNLSMVDGSIGKSYSSEQDKFLGVLPFFHIYGLTMLVQQPLARGIELVVMPAFDLKAFLHTIQTHRITFVYVAPPVIVRLARDQLVDTYDLSSLRMITSGAAPLTRELVDAIDKRLHLKLNQAYGMSETSPITHAQPWDEWYSSVGSVGKMLPNMLAKYMTADGEEITPSASPSAEPQAGELWLAGPNVTPGYWQNEAATTDSFADADGHRYFKTGDVGYQDAAGNFYITDRVKELIKYSGWQVAPAELEGKLIDHPLVADVAVIGVDNAERHTEEPRAYVVHAKRGKEAGDEKTGEPVTEQDRKDAVEIAEWLAGRVANHKRLRGGVRFVAEIPKSATGKILRRVLKERAKAEKPKAKL